jgi:hypothetical protein
LSPVQYHTATSAYLGGHFYPLLHNYQLLSFQVHHQSVPFVTFEPVSARPGKSSAKPWENNWEPRFIITDTRHLPFLGVRSITLSNVCVRVTAALSYLVDPKQARGQQHNVRSTSTQKQNIEHRKSNRGFLVHYRIVYWINPYRYLGFSLLCSWRDFLRGEAIFNHFALLSIIA